MANKQTNEPLTELQQMEKQSMLTNRIAVVLLILGLICLLVLPGVLTQFKSLISFNDKTGWIGDTIGGITSPVSGFLGAALVYLALREQIKANTLIIRQFEHQKNDDRNNKRMEYISVQIQILRESIKEFVFNDNFIDQTDYYGTTGIAEMLRHYGSVIYHNKDIEDDSFQHLHELKNFLSTILYLLNLTDQLEEEDKLNLVRVISETYRTRLYPSLTKYQNKRLSLSSDCTMCEFRHGLPESLYRMYDTINQKLSISV